MVTSLSIHRINTPPTTLLTDPFNIPSQPLLSTLFRYERVTRTALKVLKNVGNGTNSSMTETVSGQVTVQLQSLLDMAEASRARLHREFKTELRVITDASPAGTVISLLTFLADNHYSYCHILLSHSICPYIHSHSILKPLLLFSLISFSFSR